MHRKYFFVCLLFFVVSCREKKKQLNRVPYNILSSGTLTCEFLAPLECILFLRLCEMLGKINYNLALFLFYFYFCVKCHLRDKYAYAHVIWSSYLNNCIAFLWKILQVHSHRAYAYNYIIIPKLSAPVFSCEFYDSWKSSVHRISLLWHISVCECNSFFCVCIEHRVNSV